ncbi:MAG: ABC transporter ATP-binding protein/permease [Bdellovibrionales bacterium]|nr:ABC transporter ATP-binding protein/permease [Bdellovibrionales bacterium]
MKKMGKHVPKAAEKKMFGNNSENHWLTFKQLALHLWPKRRWDLKVRVLLSLGALMVAKLANVYMPFLYKQTVDDLNIKPGIAVIPLALIISYGSARFVSSFFSEVRDFIFVRVSQHAQRTIALETFKHLHHMSLGFHLTRQTGGLSRVIERGVKGIQFVLTFMLFNILPTLFELTVVTVILGYTFEWKIALIPLGAVSIYIVFTLMVTEWRLKFRRKMNKNDNEANTKAIDSLLNYETVKYFGNEEHEYRRYDRNLAAYELAAVQSQTSLSILNMGQNLIVALALVAVLWLAAQGVIAGQMTIGDYVLINTYLLQLYMPLNFLGFVYREIKQSLTDMDQMFQLNKMKEEISDKDSAVELKCSSGELAFEDVSFDYDPTRPLLRNITFRVPPGKTVAVVGPSGSGKSTLSRLIFRFYEVGSGRITIDGQDLRDVKQKSLRSCLGMVPQDAVLFNDTIGYNIHYGNPSATDKEMHEAAHRASIGDFIESLPLKYKSEVGERGLKLSGGEKQRVAIARAILKNPKIMIFDEATSSLDSKTEVEIQQSLDEVSADRTTLVIAHRLSTVVGADEILVLKQGQIVERGTHQKLLELNGEYSSLWSKQQSERQA